MPVKRKTKKPVVVAVSGYFNPLHVGHLEMIAKAKKLGDKLVAIVNSDYQVELKGRVPFMKENDRLKIIKALRDVDEVFLSLDRDLSVCRSLAKVRPDIFANGGDRDKKDAKKTLSSLNPEQILCQKLGIKMAFNVGRDGKMQSSSWLLEKFLKTVNNNNFHKSS